MSARLLMIALDAADGRLLDQWSAGGQLPHLAALRERGRSKRLTAPEGVTDDALWASFQYGAPLGEHGRYHYRLRLRSGKFGMAHLDEGDREPFWLRLANGGFRVAVLDVPKCTAPRPVNGIHLADWLVHGRIFREPRSYPESLASEVVALFGPAPPSRCGYRQPILGDDDVREITENLRLSIARKRAAGLHYLASESWDLFIIGFKEAHCAGHGLWDLADPRHAAYDAARDARLGEPVRRIFEDIDSAICDLVAAARPDAEIVVFSTSDMQPNGTLDHLMPEIVRRLNAHLWKEHATSVARAIAALRGREATGRYCTQLPYNENFGALRLAAKRGNPEDQRTLVEIEALLHELADADKGKRALTSFTRPASEEDGTRAASLPDLLIHYPTNVFPSAVVSSCLGRIEAESPRLRPGNHAPGGFAIVAGEALGRSFDRLASISDFAPLAAEVLQGSALGTRATRPVWTATSP